MFTILVPTDFSDNANNALEHAIRIANRMDGSRVVLYHVYRVPASTGSFVSVERFMRQDAEQDMQKLMQKIAQKSGRKTILEYKIVRGNTISIICDVADKSSYDLIVMGTQGASGLKEIFIGSNTAGIMNKTKTPVLAIPTGAVYRDINHIVLSMDSEPISSASVVQSLKRISDAYESKISVFHMEQELVGTGVDMSVDSFLDNISYTTYYRDKQESVNDGINTFVQSESADLLCMIRRKRGFFYELFHGSTTRKEVFNTPVPLLILHD